MKRRAQDTEAPRSLASSGLLELTVTHDKLVDAEHPHVETRTRTMAFNAARVITATPHSDGQGTTLFVTGNKRFDVAEPYHTVLARWRAALGGAS